MEAPRLTTRRSFDRCSRQLPFGAPMGVFCFLGRRLPPPLRFEIGQREPRRQRRGGDLFVAVLQRWIAEPHPTGQSPHHLAVAARFSQRRNSALVQRDILMAPCAQHIEVFELGGRWQHNVGVARRVGHEVFEHDGEEVFAAQATPHPGRIGQGHRGIGGPDHQPLHGRDEIRVAENRAKPGHVEAAWLTGLQVGAARLVFVHLGHCVEEKAAAGTAPVAS